MKQQFFVSDNDADRCKEAFRLRKPISVNKLIEKYGRMGNISK
jgi:hypothetical protein